MYKRYDEKTREEVVGLIRDFKRKGLTAAAVSNELNKRGTFRASGKHWTPTAVAVYASKNRKSKKVKKPAFDVLFDQAVKGIPVQDTLDLATLVLKANVDSTRKQKLLRGLFR